MKVIDAREEIIRTGRRMDKISCIVCSSYNDAPTTCGLVEELLGINCLDSVVVVDNAVPRTIPGFGFLGLARPDDRADES